MKRFAAVLLMIIGARAFAGEQVTDIAEVGPHYRLVTIDKSVHPQNRLAAYTRLDAQCRILRDPERGNAPVFDFYWLMDGARYKPVSRLIKRGILRRFAVESDSATTGGDAAFAVRLKELDEVENDLGPSPRLRVLTWKTAAGCRAEARVALGPSDGNIELRIDTIYSEASLTRGFGARVNTIALQGVDAKSGKPILRVYRAAR
jgi:hypothetical protein